MRVLVLESELGLYRLFLVINKFKMKMHVHTLIDDNRFQIQKFFRFVLSAR